MIYKLEQIDKTIERASKIFSRQTYMGRKLAVLKDLRDKKTQRSLTLAQINYLNRLMEVFCDSELDKAESWSQDWHSNNELRERGDIISKYYISQKGWFMDIARTVQDSLSGIIDHTPDFQQFDRMVENEYAVKVWKSHKAPHRWKAGELVCCRANAKTEGWSYHDRSEGISIYKDPCMVIESGSKPISNATKYDEKRGGCRWVSINPIGTNRVFHVMEKDLKIYRPPKKKGKKK